MDIRIVKGMLQHVDDCEEILTHSELGERYFAGEGSARAAVLEGLAQNQLLVARRGEICIGFLVYLPKGAFHSFPYLHILAVRDTYRSRGVGGQMIGYLEQIVFANANKIFLVVADFNPRAKRFYERTGYRQVGEIPNLYRQGITEYVMMKEKGW